jgi:outer membrane protein assembly factor BamB
MTMNQTIESTSRKPLRLWPGVIIAALLVLARFVLPMVAPDARPLGFPIGIVAMLLGGIFGFAIVVWWMFFSRARWVERLEALIVMILAVVATQFFLHESFAGAAGQLYYMLALSTLALAFVAWAVTSPRLSVGPRRASMIASILLGCGIWALVRTGGISGNGNPDFQWRWTASAEQRLLTQSHNEAVDSGGGSHVAPQPPLPGAPTEKKAPVETPRIATTPSPAAAAKSSDKPLIDEAEEDPKPAAPTDAAGPDMSERAIRRVEWPGFRGPHRDGVIRGVRINTDWTRSPPVELWRRPVGPGWSSFAVDGDLVYTQEQRGDDEVVSCYRRSTGEPVWRHRDPARFYETAGGAGPRGTPTVHNGRVYALGATGILNALDAASGDVLWSRNAPTDTGVTVPGWGVASSPLIVDDLVIVAVSGQLVAYDVRNGNQRWLGPKGGAGYSSPHLVTIDGVDQIVLLRGSRTIGVAPADGTLLWEHIWQPGVGIVQPAQTSDGDILITTGDSSGLGIRRVAVAKTTAGWNVEERWTSRGLKPYFNDFVVHKDHAFGFDGSILSCIDLADGSRKWKGGRYGHGQLVVLPEQDLLLVLSEEGELALVKATSDQFTEVARFPALNGKTWNHPVVVGDVLLVRNGEEMVAFRLPSETPLSLVR